ncbi:hypothetical protein C8J56DRAFT_955429 [Mycena floridula]|nr:hypothetical protein C8J56DRAFT_955429 [Mycena floridula]
MSFNSTNPNPPTPAFSDDLQWITAYLVIHMMSSNSRRYAYILWIIVAFTFAIFSILHWTRHISSASAAYRKWAIRRRTWRGKHFFKMASKRGQPAYPISLPPNGQLLCLFTLSIVALVLAFVGPDYISPTKQLFDLSARSYDVSTYVQFQPQYSITKAWWTAGGRTGLIAFALFPLCMLFVLKASPFAIFSLPYTTQIHFDKLVWLHRWSARLIWLMTTLHVALWSIQLSKDTRVNTGKMAYTYVWVYPKFIFGWLAYLLLTLILVFSIQTLRKQHYEIFYGLHVLLVPLTLVMAALHHPPVSQWCWAALALWLGERLWRSTWWFHINGFMGREQPAAAPHYGTLVYQPAYPPSPFSKPSPEILPYTPPPGFVHAELLSGATVRLTYVTPGFLSWAPGTHFLIKIPSINRFTTHPFTVASVCDEQSSLDSGRLVVFLVRCRGGWTRDLWDKVGTMSQSGKKKLDGESLPKNAELPSNGVLLKMYVEGPFGSAVRARWGDFSTVVIFVAGSGVSFGLSIMEYVCMCLAGRSGKYLGGRAGLKHFNTRRVRFVWLIREYGHIQWCATSIRRCLAMTPLLEVDIFVPNFIPVPVPRPRSPAFLVPPSPSFFEGTLPYSAYDSEDGVDSIVDLSYYTLELGDEEANLVPGDMTDYTRELTEFEGENEKALSGEALLNNKVRKLGKVRRAQSRKAARALVRAPSPSVDEYQSRNHSRHSSMTGLLAHEYHPPIFREPLNQTPSHSAGRNGRVLSSLAVPTSLVEYSGDLIMSALGEPEDSDGGLRLHLHNQELHDISMVSEHVRSGKPKIDRILEDEVKKSAGSTIVACCGPSSFNALVRKAVAGQINPSRIFKGDIRGHVELVSEDYGY